MCVLSWATVSEYQHKKLLVFFTFRSSSHIYLVLILLFLSHSNCPSCQAHKYKSLFSIDSILWLSFIGGGERQWNVMITAITLNSQTIKREKKEITDIKITDFSSHSSPVLGRIQKKEGAQTPHWLWMHEFTRIHSMLIYMYVCSYPNVSKREREMKQQQFALELLSRVHVCVWAY